MNESLCKLPYPSRYAGANTFISILRLREVTNLLINWVLLPIRDMRGKVGFRSLVSPSRRRHPIFISVRETRFSILSFTSQCDPKGEVMDAATV
jgi:hypothetical protein